MPDLDDGATLEMKGSGAKPYIIKNVGGVYSCTCPAWRNQSLPPYQRTCKHIRKLRGDAAEEARLGAAAVAAPIKEATAAAREAPGVLLAESWDTESNVIGWWMSEKLDGVRAYWDGKQLISRLGNTFTAPEYFTEKLPDVPLDGELWVARKAFNRTSGIVKGPPTSAAWKEVRYVVFDAPAHGGPFEARLRFLDDLLGESRSEFVQQLEHQICRGSDHLLAELDRVSLLGAEGLMLRQPGSKYVSGRSATLLKVKRFHDAEGRVVGYQAGAGKHKGRVGSLEVEYNGVRFSVGTGLSDAERMNPPTVGSIITFRYQELSEYNVPRFPSYVGLRADGLMTPAPVVPVVPAAKPIRPAASPASSTSTRRFEYTSGSEVRLWEVTHKGNEVTLRFGSPSTPRTKSQTYATPAEAMAAVNDMIAEKLDDGFAECVAVAPPTSPPAPAPVAKASPAVAPAAPFHDPDGRRMFEFVEGTSSKFWEVWVTGCRVTTRYGRIGSKGTMTVKDHPDETTARRSLDKLIAEKVGKGYDEKTVAVTAESPFPAALIAALESSTSEAGEALLADDCVFFVDFREDDPAIPESCEEVLRTGALSVLPATATDDRFAISFRGKSVRVPLTYSPEDRHITLVTLNEVLAPEYEVRLCIDSVGSDTLGFLPLACSAWAELERRYPATVCKRFYRLAESPNVFTDELTF